LIAAQLYTVRDQLQDPSRVGEVLRRLRDIGYRAVEVAGLGPGARERFGAELAGAEMLACAAHVSLERLVSDLDGVAAECREWGCTYVVLPSLPDEYRSEGGYRRFAAEAVELAARLRAFALQLVYHNHSHELERYGNQTGLDVLFGAAAAGDLEAELDTYWLQHGGLNPAACIRRFKGRVPLVHLKDMAVRDGKPLMAEVGEGNLDWPDILNAC
jgi:sugar phosphate isomerase/epimerase